MLQRKMITPSSPPFHFCEGLQNGHLSVKSQCIETPPTDYSVGGTNAWCSLLEGRGRPLSSSLWALSQLMQCRWRCNCKHKVEWNILLLCILEKPISDFLMKKGYGFKVVLSYILSTCYICYCHLVSFIIVLRFGKVNTAKGFPVAPMICEFF